MRKGNKTEQQTQHRAQKPFRNSSSKPRTMTLASGIFHINKVWQIGKGQEKEQCPTGLRNTFPQAMQARLSSVLQNSLTHTSPTSPLPNATVTVDYKTHPCSTQYSTSAKQYIPLITLKTKQDNKINKHLPNAPDTSVASAGETTNGTPTTNLLSPPNGPLNLQTPCSCHPWAGACPHSSSFHSHTTSHSHMTSTTTLPLLI